MTPRLLLADQLALAALSGSAEVSGVRARCAQVIAAQPRWLTALAQLLIARHAHAWHAHSRAALRESVLHYRPFRRAQTDAAPPRAHRLVLQADVPATASLAAAVSFEPDLATPGGIARWLGLRAEEVNWFAAAHRGLRADPPPKAAHYRYRWVRKRAGGWRLLEAPKPRLRDMQRLILHGILDGIAPHEAAHGFRSGRSVLTHATAHVGKRVVIRMDLRDFFLGIRAGRINGLFKAMGFPAAAAAMLTALCTARVPAALLGGGDDRGVDRRADGPVLSWSERQPFLTDHLPQGAPTSPALSNLCAFGMDVRLTGLAHVLGATYTRYADDLVFSGDEALRRAADRVQAYVGAIATEEGFAVNHRKTRVMPSARRQEVTGVIVNVRPNTAREHYDLLKATLHNACGAELSDAWKARIRGHIAQVSSLNAARGARLHALYLAVTGAS